jgi:hypothetical protein
MLLTGAPTISELQKLHKVMVLSCELIDAMIYGTPSNATQALGQLPTTLRVLEERVQTVRTLLST